MVPIGVVAVGYVDCGLPVLVEPQFFPLAVIAMVLSPPIGVLLYIPRIPGRFAVETLNLTLPGRVLRGLDKVSIPDQKSLGHLSSPKDFVSLVGASVQCTHPLEPQQSLDAGRSSPGTARQSSCESLAD